MSLTKFNKNVKNIQSLPNQPTEPAEALKKAFDQAGIDIKDYLNEILTAEIDAITNSLRSSITTIENNENQLFNKVYPVGSIYMSVNSTDPSTLFGGTWVAWGSGRVPIGVGTGTDSRNESRTFDVEQTGGEYKHQLTVGELASHTHVFNGYEHNHNLNGHTHSIPQLSGYTDWKDLQGKIWNVAVQSSTAGLQANGICSKEWTSGDIGCAQVKSGSGPDYTDTVLISAGHSHNVSTYENTTGQAWGNTGNATAGGYNDNTGNDEAHNNVQPYITCYMWKRTA